MYFSNVSCVLSSKSLSPGLAPLKGEGSLAPLRDSSPGWSLGSSLGASSAGGTLGGTTLGTGPLGGGSLGRGSLGGSLGGGSLGGSLGKGSLGVGSTGGLGTGGRLSNVEQYMDPFQQAPLGTIKDTPGVSFLNSNLYMYMCVFQPTVHPPLNATSITSSFLQWPLFCKTSTLHRLCFTFLSANLEQFKDSSHHLQLIFSLKLLAFLEFPKVTRLFPIIF